MIGTWMALAFYGAGVNVIIDVYIMETWSCLGDRTGVTGYININNDLSFLCNSFNLPGFSNEWNCVETRIEVLRVQTRS